MDIIRTQGQPLVPGEAEGQSLVLSEPLSFWGGIDPQRGNIIDRHHPQTGHSTTGKILILPHGRGSSTGAAVLAEIIRSGTGPAGIILGSPDHIITVGVLAAAELYPDRPCPLVVISNGYQTLSSHLSTRILPSGAVEQNNQVGTPM